jgi:hypothetical protein
MDLAQDIVFKSAKLIDREYKINIKDLNDADKLGLISKFMTLSANLDAHLQEYLDDACMDRMYAESQVFGGWDE